MANPLLKVTKKAKILHKVTIDKKNYPYYAIDKVYADTGSVLGVSVVKPEDDLQNDLNIKSELAAGRIRFIQVSDIDGNAYRLICSGDNVKTALGKVKQKTIDGKAINTAWIPGRRSYR